MVMAYWRSPTLAPFAVPWSVVQTDFAEAHNNLGFTLRQQGPQNYSKALEQLYLSKAKDLEL
jgi:hypothetical protein